MNKENRNMVENDEIEKRTTLTLSLTVNDKKALKKYAAEHETTIAAVIHGWIAEKCIEVE